MIRAVIFDCFGVLYLDPSRHFYETRIARYDELHDKLLELNAQADYGLISGVEHHQAVSDLSGISVGEIEKALNGSHKCNRQLVAYSQQLRLQYKIGLLSNSSLQGMETFFDYKERRHLFDASLLSAEIGLTKPHPEVFREIANRLGVVPSECVMIDDVDDNCAGADAAGMQAIHYRTNAQTRRELEQLLTKR